VILVSLLEHNINSRFYY